jgi:hypothetical protein
MELPVEPPKIPQADLEGGGFEGTLDGPAKVADAPPGEDTGQVPAEEPAAPPGGVVEVEAAALGVVEESKASPAPAMDPQEADAMARVEEAVNKLFSKRVADSGAILERLAEARRAQEKEVKPVRTPNTNRRPLHPAQNPPSWAWQILLLEASLQKTAEPFEAALAEEKAAYERLCAQLKSKYDEVVRSTEEAREQAEGPTQARFASISKNLGEPCEHTRFPSHTQLTLLGAAP